MSGNAVKKSDAQTPDYYVDPVLARIAHARGAASLDPEDVYNWLFPNLVNICSDLSVIPNFDRCANTVLDAAMAGRKIVVFGDYDADGICSIASMLRFCDLLQQDVYGFVPHRLEDGHGVSDNAVLKILRHDPECLIILDCGTTNETQLALLAETINDIVIVDHHSLEEGHAPNLPKNVSLINAAIDPDAFIKKEFGIASAGVMTYLFALHLCRIWREKSNPKLPFDSKLAKEALLDCLGLASITAISDMVPLVGLNRAIVQKGLVYAGGLTGIQAMAQKLPKPLDTAQIQPGHVGFKYAPILNAAGRISDGQLALKLMRAKTIDDALCLAEKAIEVNFERREIQQDVIQNCLAELGDGADHGNFFVDTNFHQGVVGLAASKLLEKTGRPSIVIGTAWAGSGRSVNGFHIGDFIHKQVAKGYLVKGGGHAGAGGFTAKSEHIEDFREAFYEATRGIKKAELVPDIYSVSLDIPDLLELSRHLYPFGMANPPLFIEVKNPAIEFQKWFGKGEKKHYACKLRSAFGRIECIKFSAADEEGFPVPQGQDILPGSVSSLNGEIQYEWDDYHGGMFVKLIIKNITLKDVDPV